MLVSRQEIENCAAGELARPASTGDFFLKAGI